MRRYGFLFPVAAVFFWTVVFFYWTSGCSSYTFYSEALSNAEKLSPIIPNLKLINHLNEETDVAEFRGKYVLINFIYLECPDVCPKTMFALKSAYAKVPKLLEKDLRFLTISFDKKDSFSEKVYNYWSSYGCPKFWTMAVLKFNNTDQSEALVRFGVLVKKDRLGRYNHTNFLFLVNPFGAVVKVFYPDQNIVPVLKKIIG